MCNIFKILGYDFMMKNEDNCEEFVCGELVLLFDVDDLFNLFIVEDSFVVGFFDFSVFC